MKPLSKLRQNQRLSLKFEQHSLYTTPPTVAVPQPQTQAAPAPTPLQDLLGRSANVYEQPSTGPSRLTEPDLHRLQPVDPHPHHGYSEQPHHQQQAQARQEHYQSQDKDINTSSNSYDETRM